MSESRDLVADGRTREVVGPAAATDRRTDRLWRVKKICVGEKSLITTFESASPLFSDHENLTFMWPFAEQDSRLHKN